jgi:hypothetical protein
MNEIAFFAPPANMMQHCLQATARKRTEKFPENDTHSGNPT